MSLNTLEQHRIIKLIEYSIDKQSFSTSEALNYTGMGLTEYIKVASQIYCEGKEINHTINMGEIMNWHLTPEALFQYMSFLEYRDSLKSAKQARVIAIISIIISGILALAALLT